MKKLMTLLCAAAGLATAAQAQVTFVEVTGNISVDTRWTRNNVYILREVVHVLPPAKLSIEAGTIIRGVREGSGFDTAALQSPGALIVARGAQIYAEGTADDPIVFTSVDDPNVIGGVATVPATVNGIAVPAPGTKYSADGAINVNGFAYDAQWGGLVVLGEAPIGYDADGDGAKLQYNPGTNTYAGDAIAFPSGALSPLNASHDIKGGDGIGLAIIEGAVLSSVAATYTDPFPGALLPPPAGQIYPAVYGGLDRNDNNGVLFFTESRYGGFVIGTANELNGITFGATGTLFWAEWLSSYNNADDGFEFFGGYTHFRFLFSLYQGDDGLDGDQGFNGTIQHAFVLVDDQSQARVAAWGGALTGRIAANIGDNGAEWDGSEEVDQGGITPNSEPYVYNFTICPSPAAGKDGTRQRRGTDGLWMNGLWQDVPDDAWRIDAVAPPNSTLPVVTVQDFNVYANVGDAATELGATKYSDAPASVPPALNRELVSIPRSTWPAGFGPGSLDPRLAAGAVAASPLNFNKPADRVDAYPFADWVDAPIGAAMRDNNMLAWTVLDRIKDAAGNDLVVNNTSRPALVVDEIAGAPRIAFTPAPGVGGRAAIYVIECRLPGSCWLPVAVISDNNGAGTLDKSGATFAALDENAGAGSVRWTHSASPFVPGQVRCYRVWCL